MNADQWVKGLSILGGVVAFGWGVYQFVATQQLQSETRRIEATKPFLERQLKLYTEATQATSVLATSKEKTEIETSTKKFWSLYWGELALVEDKRVEAAMIEFGDVLKAQGPGPHLGNPSLALAHACRDSLADSWGVGQWRSPHRDDR
jgi:hypothetical protein